MYQKTVRLNVPSNGEYQIVIPNNEKVKDWRGNYFHISESNPSFIMHIPYTYLSGTPIQDWLMIYVYAQGNVFVCNFQGGGQYETGYFNGVAVITYKYIKS